MVEDYIKQVEKRVRMTIRNAEMNRNYTDELSTKLMHAFLGDMVRIVTIEYLARTDDTNLAALYTCWERVAKTYPMYEDRILVLMTSFKTFILVGLEKSEPPELPTNVFTLH